MADSSLDDFFAKKDRNKKKSKQKTAPSEFIAQPETVTRKTKKKPEKEKQTTSNVVRTQPSEEDLEWNDYEQETEKDYSGLRIQNLQIKSDDDDDDENELNQDNNENSESGERQESSQGPWSKQGAQTPPAPSPTPAQETPEPVAPVAQETPKSVGRYIPPSQRGNSSSAASVTRTRLAKKTAPNIQSEVDFPTLGGGGTNDVEKKYIDRVRNNNRNYEDPSNHSLPLKLNNKFKVLED
ncbi:protein CDV3 homolog [Octopus bimaculoides]|uniref:Protein CDV3 homolog n=1 Tax=Octopus bimaculoides TaxID=37653 RepID=A0A0L8I992_OCTBM|nr:protein CDV3 homolog [Octopus bimaculoides]|eukprot:XP_014787806.1 PREDICTED: protein CDV3 homolog [Octopus bimaculoides]